MILETLIQALTAHTQALNAHTAALQGAVGTAPAPQTTYATPATTHMLGAPPPPPVPSNIDSDKITALIQPHVANPQIKEALGVAMRSMGINALPETQPHQYAGLYAAFQGVIDRFTTGVGVAQQVNAPPPPSII